MDALKSLVQPLMGSSSSVVDGMKLVVLGGTVETARRVSSSAWQHFVNSFFLTAHFCEEEHTYDWLMLWLSRRPEWQRSREFEATLRAFSQSSPSTTNATKSPADVEWEEAEREWERYNSSLNGSARQTMHSSDIYTPPNTDEDPDPVPVDKPRSRIVFQPTYNTTHTLFFRGHYLHIKRSRHPESYSEMLSISVIARSNAILKQLVLQAKKEYEAECVHRIQIYLADAHGSWRWTDSRAKRPLGSIVLNPGVKEMLVEDTKDFLRSEKWYMDRGIPFRRGYLLYGVPGSGKSSLIHALSGYLGLDIYVVSLSSSWMSDSTLTSLMGRVPSRCVVLLEDLDAAFTRSTSRDDDDELEELLNSMGEGKKSGSNSNSNNGNSGSNNHSSSSSSRRHRHSSKNDSLSSTNTLSLSGLLNALDGISASEGRLLFATTNHLDKLDPALRRPGRMDVWIEFKNASKVQAEGLFRNFFVPDDDPEDTGSPSDNRYSGSEDPEVQARRDRELDEAMKGIDIKISTTPLSGSSVSSSALPTPTSPSPASDVQGSTSSSSLWSLASSATSLLGGASPLSALSSEAGSPITMASPLPMTASSFAMPSVILESSTPAPSSPMDAMAASTSTASASSIAAGRRRLERKTLIALAKQFGEVVPEQEFSVACLQGYLLKHKTNPHLAIENLPEFIASERKLRETLAAQKASAQAQSQQAREKRIAELKAKKLEREEKERREDRDREVERIKEQLKEKEREEELKGLKEKLKEMDQEKAEGKDKDKDEKEGAEAKKEEKDEKKDEKKDGEAPQKSDEEEDDKENWSDALS